MTSPNKTESRQESARPPWARHGHRPPWMQHAHVRPPFGLHRRIFWSLVASTMVANLVTALAFRLWTPAGEPSFWAAVGFGAIALATLWMASWRVSWRLVSPLNRVVRVVQQLGNGDLSARAGFRADTHDEVARCTPSTRWPTGSNNGSTTSERCWRSSPTSCGHHWARPCVDGDGARWSGDAIDQDRREVSEIDDLVAKVLVRSRLMFGTMTMRDVSMVSAVREALERAGLSTALLVEDGARVVGTTADNYDAQTRGARRGVIVDASAEPPSSASEPATGRADTLPSGSARDIVRADPRCCIVPLPTSSTTPSVTVAASKRCTCRSLTTKCCLM